jgi:hypothetical protein
MLYGVSVELVHGAGSSARAAPVAPTNVAVKTAATAQLVSTRERRDPMTVPSVESMQAEARAGH